MKTARRRHHRGVLTSLDRRFDRLLPHDLRNLSSTHWTPVRVAVRAAALSAGSHTRVLDPSGTRVVAVHGFGGVMPPTFDLLYHELLPSVGLDLAMWIQRTRRSVVRVAS